MLSQSEEESIQPEDRGQGSHLPVEGEPSLESGVESRPANVGLGQDKVQLVRGPIFRGERNASALGKKGIKT